MNTAQISAKLNRVRFKPSTGTPTERLALINTGEANLLKRFGGQGKMTKLGVRSYTDPSQSYGGDMSGTQTRSNWNGSGSQPSAPAATVRNQSTGGWGTGSVTGYSPSAPTSYGSRNDNSSPSMTSIGGGWSVGPGVSRGTVDALSPVLGSPNNNSGSSTAYRSGDNTSIATGGSSTVKPGVQLSSADLNAGGYKQYPSGQGLTDNSGSSTAYQNGSTQFQDPSPPPTLGPRDYGVGNLLAMAKYSKDGGYSGTSTVDQNGSTAYRTNTPPAQRRTVGAPSVASVPPVPQDNSMPSGKPYDMLANGYGQYPSGQGLAGTPDASSGDILTRREALLGPDRITPPVAPTARNYGSFPPQDMAAGLDPTRKAVYALANQYPNITAGQVAKLLQYESAGTMNPQIKGGTGGKYMGLFQAGPKEQQKYGIGPNSSVGDEVNALGSFLKDRGMPRNGTLGDMYTTINAGSGTQAKYGWKSDGNPSYPTINDKMAMLNTPNNPYAQKADAWLNNGDVTAPATAMATNAPRVAPPIARRPVSLTPPSQVATAEPMGYDYTVGPQENFPAQPISKPAELALRFGGGVVGGVLNGRRTGQALVDAANRYANKPVENPSPYGNVTVGNQPAVQVADRFGTGMGGNQLAPQQYPQANATSGVDPVLGMPWILDPATGKHVLRGDPQYAALVAAQNPIMRGVSLAA